jgi:uncharacterized protein YjiS (DUF1127 family)
MPAITTLSYAASSVLGNALVAFGRRLVRQLKRLERAIEHRRAMQVLARLDDRMLADIGLSRSDVGNSYVGSLFSDTTTNLRARALERRLARYGISHGFVDDKPVAPSIVPKVDTATVSQARVAFCHCE